VFHGKSCGGGVCSRKNGLNILRRYFCSASGGGKAWTSERGPDSTRSVTRVTDKSRVLQRTVSNREMDEGSWGQEEESGKKAEGWCAFANLPSLLRARILIRARRGNRGGDSTLFGAVLRARARVIMSLCKRTERAALAPP